MVKGGKRPGAGRKQGSKSKKTIEQEKALEVLREEIRKNWGELLQSKLELAKGIWVERRIGKNRAFVYREKPDSQSLEYLFSMVVGKPKETLELEGGKLPFTVIIKKGDPKNGTN